MTIHKYTRCPGCATVFRITAAQLALREGQVRCGQCRAVFDANDHLVDVDEPSQDESMSGGREHGAGVAGPPHAAIADSAEGGRPSEETRAEPEYVEETQSEIAHSGETQPEKRQSGQAQPEERKLAAPLLDGALPESPPLDATRQDETPPEGTPPERPPLGEGPPPEPPRDASRAAEARDDEAGAEEANAATVEAAAQPDGEPGESEGLEASEEAAAAAAEAAPGKEEAVAAAAEAALRSEAEESSPASARSDERTAESALLQSDARADEAPGGTSGTTAAASASVPAIGTPTRFEWKPRKRFAERRAWYAGAIVALLAGIALQILLEYRDLVAAHLPFMRPVLEGACRPIGCTIEPLRDAAALSIDASDLQADPAHRGLLQLSATIRNRASYAIAYPHLELTLTDSADQVVVRRAFAPGDYAGGTANPAAGIPGNGERLVRLFIDASATAQAGYRLYLFYP